MPPLCLEENLPVINGNRWFSYLLVNSFANWPIFWDSQGHILAVSHLSTSSDFSVTKPCFKPGCPDRKPEKGNTPSSCRCVLYGSVEATVVQQLLATSFSLWCSFILILVGVFPENKPGQMNLVVSFLGMLYMCNTCGPPVSVVPSALFPAHLAALAQWQCSSPVLCGGRAGYMVLDAWFLAKLNAAENDLLFDSHLIWAEPFIERTWHTSQISCILAKEF